MELGLIGLGAMGSGLAARVMRRGHRLVVFDLHEDAVDALVASGAEGVRRLEELAPRLGSPRAIWVMLPAGAPTERALNALAHQLSPGDVVLDGGNSHYRDSMRHAASLAARGVELVDVGVSGGEGGAAHGYSLMVGGEEAVIDRLRPIFEALAPASDRGWGRVGAGHFAKMVHNGIEYGMMQAYAEGLGALVRTGEFEFDLRRVVTIWRPAAVVRSWLLDLVGEALERNPELGRLAPYVADAGPQRWTVDEAVDQLLQRGYDRWYRPE